MQQRRFVTLAVDVTPTAGVAGERTSLGDLEV